MKYPLLRKRVPAKLRNTLSFEICRFVHNFDAVNKIIAIEVVYRGRLCVSLGTLKHAVYLTLCSLDYSSICFPSFSGALYDRNVDLKEPDMVCREEDDASDDECKFNRRLSSKEVNELTDTLLPYPFPYREHFVYHSVMVDSPIVSLIEVCALSVPIMPLV